MKAVLEALMRRAAPVEMFFRNDDAGWAQDSLDRLLEIFADAGVPVDLAVIPAALNTVIARRLDHWRQEHPGIGLHQHGFAHTNHEADGARKCEFGEARSQTRRLADIAAGQLRLKSFLGQTDPVFTPPWNRMAGETAAALAPMGFALVSDDGALAKARCPAATLAIGFDWEKHRRNGTLEQSLATAIGACRGDAPLGIMLHHETMDQAARATLAAFLSAIGNARRTAIRPMRHWTGDRP